MGRAVLKVLGVLAAGVPLLLLGVLAQTCQVRRDMESFTGQVLAGGPLLALRPGDSRRIFVEILQDAPGGGRGKPCASGVVEGTSAHLRAAGGPVERFGRDELMARIQARVRKDPRCRVLDFTFMGRTPFRCTTVFALDDRERTLHRKSHCWD